MHGKTPRENALEILRRMEMVRQLTETETQLAVARQTQDTGECSTRVEQQPQMAPTPSRTELLDRMGLLLPSSSTMLAPQPINDASHMRGILGPPSLFSSTNISPGIPPFLAAQPLGELNIAILPINNTTPQPNDLNT